MATGKRTKSPRQPWNNHPQAQVAGKNFTVDWPINFRVSHSELTARLQAAGLDPKLARSLCNSHTFRRAIKEIVPNRLKDKIAETADAITFQISARVPKVGEVEYVKEAVVTCDKATGMIACACPVTLALAQAAFNQAVGERNTNDCTRLVQRILRDRLTVDVFKRKGTWFALPSAFPLVSKLQTFVQSLGGVLDDWDIADGTPTNVIRVQTVVVDGFDQTLADAEEHIDKITSETRDDVLGRAGTKLEKIEMNLKAHARRIGDQLGRLEDYLALCRKKLADNQVKPPPTTPFRPEERGEDDQDAPETGESLPITGDDGDAVDVVIGVNTDPVPNWADPHFNPAAGLAG